nr:hypothetical protein [Tanacetum cinerariifolium]
KFDAKGDEGYFIEYSLSSKAFRVFNKRTKKIEENLPVDFLENKSIEKGTGLDWVFNKRTKKIEENLPVDFLENKSIEKGTGPDWLFDIDTLTNSMNYAPVVVAGTSSTNISGTKEDVHQAMKEKESPLRFIALPNWFHEVQMATSNKAAKKDDAIPDNNSPQKEQQEVNGDKEVPESSRNSNPTSSSKVSTNNSFELASSSIVETKVPTVNSLVPPDSLFVPSNRLEDFFRNTFNEDSLNEVETNLSNMETAIQVSPTPTLRIHKDHPKSQIISPVDTPVEAVQQELLQFKIWNVWVLVDCPNGVRPIGTKWVLKNKKDERGIVIKNKARLVAQGHIHEEGIDYKEVFEPVAKIEAIRLFLAYASYMGFTVYQMDVVEKAMYGLHQDPRAWYGTLSKYLLDNGFQRGTIYQTLFVRKQKGEFLLVQVYVDDIIFGSSNLKLCREFEALMHDKFQMNAMGELNFCIGLQVLQKKDGIFLSQDKYVGDILKKILLHRYKGSKDSHG